MTPEELQHTNEQWARNEAQEARLTKAMHDYLTLQYICDEQAATIKALQADLEKFYRITDGRQISGVYNSETDRRVEVIRRYMVESIGCDQKLQRQQADIDRLKAALIEERAFYLLNSEEDDFSFWHRYFSFWHRYHEEDRQLTLWNTTYTEPGKKTLRARARESLSVDFPDLFKEAGK